LTGRPGPVTVLPLTRGPLSLAWLLAALGPGAGCGTPQEQGARGAACYRIEDCQEGLVCAANQCTNRLDSIVGEQPMYGAMEAGAPVPPGDAAVPDGAPAEAGGAPGSDSGPPPAAGGAPDGAGGAPSEAGGAPQAAGGAPQAAGGAPQAAGGTPEAAGGAPEVAGGAGPGPADSGI
jgi:hypothetical protein